MENKPHSQLDQQIKQEAREFPPPYKMNTLKHLAAHLYMRPRRLLTSMDCGHE